MKERTLQDLQQKGWYRFLKVLYTALFILILVPSVAVILSTASPTVDNEQTQIRCLLGNGKTFSAAELNLYLAASDFDENGKFNYKQYFERYYSTQYDVRRIFEACSLDEYVDYDNVNIFLVQAVTEVKHNDLLSEAEKTDQLEKKVDAVNRNYGSDSARFLSFEPQIFTIQPVYKDRVALTAGYVALAVICVVGLFEIAKRIFYYVVLGAWVPKKNT